LKYNYRYLGIREIMIGKGKNAKAYKNGDIIRLDKPITELGFDEHQFETLSDLSEREQMRIRLKNLDKEKLEAERRLEERRIEMVNTFENEFLKIQNSYKSLKEELETRIKEIDKSLEELPEVKETIKIKRR